MPVSVSYPGVYLEEIPSGVRSITGVATAIAAFVGRTRRGPTDEAKRIYSWAEFEREYGGLWKESTVSYAVNHYFANGGTDAVIARAHKAVDTDPGDTTGDDDKAFLTFSATDSDTMVLESTSATAWFIWITQDTSDADRFTIYAGASAGDVSAESYLVSLDPDDEKYIVTMIGSEATGKRVRLVDDEVPLYRPSDIAGGVATAMSGGTSSSPAVQATAQIPLVGGTFLTVTVLTAGEAGNDWSVLVTEVGAGFTMVFSNTALGLTESWEVTTYATEGDSFLANFNANSDHFSIVDGSGTLAFPDFVTEAGPIERDFEDGADEVEGVAHRKTLTCPTSAPEDITFRAASPGEWGNNLRLSIDYNTKDTTDTDLFNIVVVELDADDPTTEVQRETFRNVSIDEASPRYVETVLEQESNLIRIEFSGTLSGRPPLAWSAVLSGGDDGAEVTDTELGTAMDLLEEVDLFTLLCIPPRTLSNDVADDIGSGLRTDAIALCDRRNAFFIVDSPANWLDADDPSDSAIGMDYVDFREKNAAIYFPRLKMPDPLKENRLTTFAPCGVVAGIMARTDAQRGVWKAPAGLEANVRGVKALTVKLTDAQQGALNQIGVNCIRTFPVVGTVIWGARTLRGADLLADDWKYVPVRRLANYLRESLYRGSKWAVFEPNDEPLWAQLRLSIGSFMQNLFRQGAFQGKTPREAYFVKCDKETTTQTDINLGIVNILVGFAPLKPAEFVIIKLQQMAGQSG